MRTGKGLFVFFLVLLFAAPAFSREAGNQIRIVVPAEVEAAGEEYFLGDIALFEEVYRRSAPGCRVVTGPAAVCGYLPLVIPVLS